MIVADLVRQFRLDMDDLEAPYLWRDEEVLGYATDAQSMFCRLTEGIADSRTPDVCKLTLVPDQEWYEIHPSILKIRSVRREDRRHGAEIGVVNAEHVRQNGINFSDHGGEMRALVAGLTDGYLRAWPKPNDLSARVQQGGDFIVLNMDVFRLPLHDLADGDQGLEIQPQHHRHLVLWMRSLAYLKQDADAYDPRSAEKYDVQFRQYCSRARTEQERARRVIGTTRYGGY